MKHLDLFSGIGGFALAAQRVGWETVGFCEIDPFCQDVLRKHWPDVPIHSDVRELTGDSVGSVDIITGGYPCQPFSFAGKRRGADDDRHLWPEFARLIREIRPRWVVGENVAGHISMGLDDVLSDLEGLGYGWEAFAIPAVAVDARHRRQRLWIVAHADQGVLRDNEQRPAQRRNNIQNGRETEPRDDGAQRTLADSARERLGETRSHSERSEKRTTSGSDVADAKVNGRRPRRTRNAAQESRRRQSDRSGISSDVPNTDSEPQERITEPRQEYCQWEPEPDVGRVANGIPNRVDRLRALGNSIVPQVAEEIFRGIKAITHA